MKRFDFLVLLSLVSITIGGVAAVQERWSEAAMWTGVACWELLWKLVTDD